jgi:hypothetical protein
MNEQDIAWTRHAEQRQLEWQRTLGVTREEVEDLVAHPMQIVPGDGNAQIAQAPRGTGLLRVVFVETTEHRSIG